MKKIFITAATLALLSTASFAETSEENRNRMDEMRHQFMVMTDQMMDHQMDMMKMQEQMLTNYKRLLKQMMENESSSHKG